MFEADPKGGGGRARRGARGGPGLSIRIFPQGGAGLERCLSTSGRIAGSGIPGFLLYLQLEHEAAAQHRGFKVNVAQIDVIKIIIQRCKRDHTIQLE